MTSTGPPSPPVVVLVEGRSDVASVEALLLAAGLPTDPTVRVVDMGGVTNVRRCLVEFTEPGRAARIVGMCDAGEVDVVIRALRDHGVGVDGSADLARFGFHVCHADLEDELLRALGVDSALGVLDSLGMRRGFEQFGRQLVWRGRDRHEQLHRFAGIASGRKLKVARAWTRALPGSSVPEPLQALVRDVGTALGRPGGAPLRPFASVADEPASPARSA